MPSNDFKKNLYDQYISSGQSIVQSDALKEAFKKEGPYIRHVIRKFFPKDESLKIIDLGCGKGAFVYFLQQSSYQDVKGYDISREQIDYAKRIGLTNIFKGDIVTVAGSLESTSVDIIILFDIIEHLSNEILYPFLKEVHRILKPGGKVFVHVPNGHGIFGNAIRYGDLTHETAFTPGSLRQLFKSTGFRRITCREDKPLLYSPGSVIRRGIWEATTFYFRLINLAESGRWEVILSRNLLAIVEK